MLKDKADILPFLFLSAHLIFAEKIVIIVMCLINAVLISVTKFSSHAEIQCAVYRIKFFGNRCRIIDVWRSIELTIKKSKYLYYNILSYKYEAVWNIIKMKC